MTMTAVQTAVPTMIPAGLRDADGAPVTLEATRILGDLRDLLATVSVTQTYRNTEDRAIEAVYTFPLPLDAVLLDVRVRLDDRVLEGRVAPKRVAERAYEEAVADGHAAVMIEHPEPGLYTLNLANLLPGSVAQITCRYAQVLAPRDGRLRFTHPTTIAPRYGGWGVEAHQVPDVSLLAQHQAEVRFTAAGHLATARVASPSHAINLARDEGAHDEGARDEGVLAIALEDGRTALDRDIVLELTPEALPEAVALVGPGRDGEASALAVVAPKLSADRKPRPRCLKIVIDCSGSMNGQSIAQARAALVAILDQLRPEDRFAVIRFGSSVERWQAHPVRATGAALAEARARAMMMTADLGGTEMAPALDAAYAMEGGEGEDAVVLLITDGHITAVKETVRRARASAQRVFTVGVGHAVTEALVRGLATATGGAAELVTPREDMARRIAGHVRRIDQGGAAMTLDWGAQPLASFDHDRAVFAGDSVVVAARLPVAPETLALSLDGAGTRSIAVTPVTGDTVARLVANRELLALGEAIDRAGVVERDELEQDAADLAVAHQLVSAWSNWIMVARQENPAAGELPEMRKVDHMLAAGWGGFGAAEAVPSMVPVSPSPMSPGPVSPGPMPSAPPLMRRASALSDHVDMAPPEVDFMTPEGLGEPGRDGRFDELTLDQIVEGLEAGWLDAGEALAALVNHLPADWLEAGRRARRRSGSIAAVVAALLRLAIDGPLMGGTDKALRRRVLSLFRETPKAEAARDDLAKKLGLAEASA